MQAQQLLTKLAGGDAISGEGLAEHFGVTRAAIWKQIEALRNRGVPIEARGAAGYRLPWPLQMLDGKAIRAGVPATVRKRLGALDVLWDIDSTSSELQRRGVDAADLSVVMAESQSAGRGRRGRTWLSPPGLNLYLSCLKRFDAGFAGLSGLSLAVGVMLLRALQSVGLTQAGLKWPNDVLADDGKLAGILVELTGEYQGPCAAVIGIGVNLRLTDALREQTGQPISDLATLAGGTPPDRNRLASALITALVEGLPQFEREGFAGFVDEYARHDILRDAAVRVHTPQGAWDGIGQGVDTRGALLVRDASGMQVVDSADVSVRRT